MSSRDGRFVELDLLIASGRGDSAPRPPAAREINPQVKFALMIASQRAGVTEAEILGSDRGAPFVHGRAIVAEILRSKGWSLPRIGRVLGRHHTSVLNLLRPKNQTKPKRPARVIEVPDLSGEWAI